LHHTVLRECRARLVAGGAALRRLDTLLERLREGKLLKPRGRQRTDATHVLAAVRVLKRLEQGGETLRTALNSVAVVAPEWLPGLAHAAWYERYGARGETSDLPKSEAERAALAVTIGTAGQRLLEAIVAAAERAWLQQMPAIKTLQRVWAEPYGEVEGPLAWRAVKALSAPAEHIASPSAPDARYRQQHPPTWGGDTGHLTAPWDADTPHLIVHVATTPATTPDEHMAPVVHTSLAQRNLFPAAPLVDRGSTDSQGCVDSPRAYGVTISGPVAADPSWQAPPAGGLDTSRFRIDWARQVVPCPAGKQRRSWLPSTSPQSSRRWEVRFSRQDCSPCSYRPQCTRAKPEPRIIGVLPREQHAALQAARQQQQTKAFFQQYAARAGVESPHEQALRRCGRRRCRYSGHAKAPLHPLITAAAIPRVRVEAWWTGIPRAPPRCSPCAALRPVPRGAGESAPRKPGKRLGCIAPGWGNGRGPQPVEWLYLPQDTEPLSGRSRPLPHASLRPGR
jgi:transposase